GASMWRAAALAESTVPRVPALARTWIAFEMPGWGRWYKRHVGNYSTDSRWAAAGVMACRNKMNRMQMRCDLGNWSGRSCYFLRRYYDLPSLLLLSAILRPGDHAMDIGANVDMITMQMAHGVGSDGRVVAAE